MNNVLHPLPCNQTALTFLFAGRCATTFEDVLTGQKWTFSIKQKVEMGYVTDTDKAGHEQKRWTIVKRFPKWYVRLRLAGETPYVGEVNVEGDELIFRATKSTNTAYVTAEIVNTFGDALRDLTAGVDRSHQLRIWHRGFCGRCGRPLTVPSSIATGIGPDCAERMGISMVDTTPTMIEKMAAIHEGVST